MGLKTTSGYIEVHPTFLYESLWNIIGFVILAIFYKKKKFNGQIFYFYMIWYGLGRAFIEGMRTDSLPLWGLTDFSGNPIRVSQALAALIFIAGVALMVFFWMKASKAKKTTVAAEVSAEAAVSAADGSECAAVTEDVNSDDSDENGSESDSDSDGGETDTEKSDNGDK